MQHRKNAVLNAKFETAVFCEDNDIPSTIFDGIGLKIHAKNVIGPLIGRACHDGQHPINLVRAGYYQRYIGTFTIQI
ncbi:hypothetical protein [Bradyrhizobium ottawaense]|uniref:hypothetical protein n=1 Tax=Bradyrhizobium ottawaense TaxID=931866 RepID=UPI00351675B9